MEIKLNGTQDAAGSTATKSLNVFYYRLTTLAGAIDKTSLAASFRTNVIVPYLAAANARYKPNSVTIRNVTDATDMPATVTQAGNGAVATDSEPSDDAVVILMLSAIRGRMCRGMKHFGGTSEADTTGDILTGAGLAAWALVRDGMKTNCTDANGNVYTPFVLSRSWSSLKAPVKIFGVNVTTCTLLKNIGTMRKRRSKTIYA
jgi:hypothetical protein